MSQMKFVLALWIFGSIIQFFSLSTILMVCASWDQDVRGIYAFLIVLAFEQAFVIAIAKAMAELTTKPTNTKE